MFLRILSCLAILIYYVSGLVHDLKISDDDRKIYKIETFGFISGGEVSLDLSGFSISNFAKSKSESIKLGFVLRKSTSESESQQDLEQIIDNGTCLLDMVTNSDIVLDLSDTDKWSKTSLQQSVPSRGLYSLIFVRCDPSGTQKVNYHLKAKFYNPGPDYLSAGDAPLPLLYFCFFLAFLLASIVWIFVIGKCFGSNGTVHNIHYMMAVVIFLKTFTLLFESIRFHYISTNGASLESWNIVYFIFAALKGIMLFTVILLIGSGWSLMKPYLNDQEKKIIFGVLILQVLDNVAMVVIEETAPGSQGWLTWRDILHLVDIICCCAILFPIVWSIRHLRQASDIDGKAQTNLQKLQLFRQFYVMVVIYIYFTRIVVLLLSATIPFDYIWLGDFSTEFATFIFYVITGYQFRPKVNNPYLPVQSEDTLQSEYGLDHDDIEDSNTHNGGNSIGGGAGGIEMKQSNGNDTTIKNPMTTNVTTTNMNKSGGISKTHTTSGVSPIFIKATNKD